MTSSKNAPVCKFISSLGGTHRCQDFLYREGLCRFHFEGYLKGEVLPNGQLNERLTDQPRRRALNYHGIDLEEPAPAPPLVQR